MKRLPVILTLGALMALTPFSIDLYLTSFPLIAAELGTSTARLALTVSAYFLGMALGQLIYGPLLDRFGRKRPLYGGLTLFVLASFGCVLVTGLDALVGLRFLQALGGCVASVAALTFARDLFPVKDSARIIAVLILILGVSPLAAPTLGNLLSQAWGWRPVFWALLSLGAAVAVLAAVVLPSGQAPDRQVSLRPDRIVGTYLRIFRQPQFFRYAGSGALAFTALLAYVSGSPVIFLSIYHLSPSTFGLVFALLAGGFVLSSQLTGWAERRWSSQAIVRTSFTVQASASALFLALAWAGWLPVTAAVVLLLVGLGALGLANPSAAALALAPFEHDTGSASALLGFLQIAVSAAASAVLGLVEPRDCVPLGLVMVVGSVGALTIVALGGGRYTPEPPTPQSP